jgi:hypothetical protein
MPDDTTAQLDKLRQAIAALEAQQRELGLDLTAQIALLQRRLADVAGISQRGSGGVATTGGIAAGAGGAAVAGDVGGHVIVTGNGSTIVIGEPPIAMTACSVNLCWGAT